MATMLSDSVFVIVLAIAPMSNTVSHDNHEKSIHGFPFLSHMGMGLRLAALQATGASLILKNSPTRAKSIRQPISEEFISYFILFLRG